MTSLSKSSLSANFYKFATACCAYYVIAQVIQEAALRHGINDAATGEQGILQRLLPLDQFRLLAILLSFVPILVAFAAVTLRRVRRSPAASVLGFTFSLLFVTAEVSTRSIDLFLVSKKWGHGVPLRRIASDPTIDRRPDTTVGRVGRSVLLRTSCRTPAGFCMLRYSYVGRLS